MAEKKFTKEGVAQVLPGFGLAALAIVFAAISFVAFFDRDSSALIFSLVIIAAALAATVVFFALKTIKSFIDGIKNNGELRLTALILAAVELIIELACVVIAIVLLILLFVFNK